MKVIKRILFCLLLVFVVSTSHAAEEFKTDYIVDYYPDVRGTTINTSVKFTTKITNLQDTYYVDKYKISFPSSFNIHDIQVTDDHGSITPDVTNDKENIGINMKLNDPKTGKNTVSTLSLQFNQDNLFKVNGNVWEVILPTMSGKTAGSYLVHVHLPPGNKKISISKPKPSSIDSNVVSWSNPDVKTIYAVFGDRQSYSLDLSYHLKNDNVYPIYTEIAFPPDTLYQQIVVSRIDPPPTSVRSDDDGNYMARYDLGPKEQKDIRFQGYAEVFSQPRDEVQPYIKAQFEKQKSYLLKSSKYWNISNPASYTHLTTPDTVFKSVAGSLSYDYQRVNTKSYRLGADTALKNPSKAVCVEFTDSFVSLARINNIYSREIEGFGFSQDDRLRPLSLLTDVLHAWPEYYDTANNIWKQVDPTWENTSGIDYFSSFDLDHIAFAIHGKSDEDPPPAGTYKFEDSHDVSVKPVAEVPSENKSTKVKIIDVPPVVTDKQSYKGFIEIVNYGNVTVYQVPVSIESNVFAINGANAVIDQLPPMGRKKIYFGYALKQGVTAKEGTVTVNINGQASGMKSVKITPFSQTVAVVVSAAVAVLLLLILLFFSLHRRKR